MLASDNQLLSISSSVSSFSSASGSVSSETNESSSFIPSGTSLNHLGLISNYCQNFTEEFHYKQNENLKTNESIYHKDVFSMKYESSLSSVLNSNLI